MRTEDPRTIRSVASAPVRCASRDEAIGAGKRLLIETADWLGPDVDLEVSICSVLAWVEPD